MALEDQLNQGWRDLLAGEIKKPYWKALDAYVAKEREANPGKIYPVEEDVFAAYNFMPYEQVRVVLIGQDPYHGPDQAHGLSFSVLPGIDVPPSLRNMYKELESDLGHKPVKHGYLKSWAEQGVMLLNTVLTVRHKEANSHRKQGWEKFTTATINLLNAREQPLVFILWGGPAKKLGAKIDRSKHIIIEAAHPSPLSAHNGFFGSKPYSKVNEALVSLGQEPIDWKLPDKVSK